MSGLTLREKISSLSRPLSLAGLLLLICAGFILMIVGFDWQPIGFLIGILVLIALPMLSPAMIKHSLGRIRITNFGISYSFKSLADRIQTTAFAVASLAIAVSMLVGITLNGVLPSTSETSAAQWTLLSGQKKLSLP